MSEKRESEWCDVRGSMCATFSGYQFRIQRDYVGHIVGTLFIPSSHPWYCLHEFKLESKLGDIGRMHCWVNKVEGAYCIMVDTPTPHGLYCHHCFVRRDLEYIYVNLHAIAAHARADDPDQDFDESTDLPPLERSDDWRIEFDRWADTL